MLGHVGNSSSDALADVQTKNEKCLPPGLSKNNLNNYDAENVRLNLL